MNKTTEDYPWKASAMRCMLQVMMLLAVGTAFGQQKNTVELIQQAYQTKGNVLLTNYKTGLETALDELKKKGDLDNFLLVEAEKKRFEKKKNVPVPSKAKESFRPVTMTYYQAQVALQEQYIKALDEQIKQEVIAGRIEEARVLKSEKDKIVIFLAENQELIRAEGVAEKQKPESVSPKKLNDAISCDLLLHFAFDNLSKTEVTDKSGKGSAGVVHGCNRVSRGNFRALKFDGKNDYLVTRADLDLSDASPWTMSVWFKATKQPRPYDNIMSIGKSSINRGIYGICAGNDVNSLNFNLWGAFNYTVKTDVDYNKAFIHVAVTYNGERACLYVNGILKDERSLHLTIVQSPVYIGGRTGGYEGQYFDGIIGETMIFKRALTAAEVEALYTAQQ